MRYLALFFLLSCCAAIPAQETEPAPDPLLDAGHCLATAHVDWLNLAPDRPYELELGYLDDTKSDSGPQLLYLVRYTARTHAAGVVFAFAAQGREAHAFLSHNKDTHRILRLEYRVEFRQSDDGSQQVELVDPPLGGVGTQDQIVQTIRQIGFHTWTVPVMDLVNHASAVQCETDTAVD